MDTLMEKFIQLKKDICVKDKPVVVFHSHTPETVIVSCDWSNIIPETVQKPANSDPKDVRWKFTWSTTEDFLPGTVTEVSEWKETSHVIQDTNLSYQQAVHVQVKPMLPIPFDSIKPPSGKSEPTDARTNKFLKQELDKQKKNFFGDAKYVEAEIWSPKGKGTQVPFLKPPTSVSFVPLPQDATQGTVSVAGTLPQLDIKVAVVDSPDTLLYEETRKGPEDGSDKFETNVRLIAPPKFEIGIATRLVVSSARQHSSDESKNRYSAWIKSKEQIPIVDTISTLAAVMKGANLKVTWNAQAKVPDPQIFIFKNKQWLPHKSKPVSDPAVSTREAILVPLDEISHGEKIVIAVSDTVIPAGSIALFSRCDLDLDFLPLVSINPQESYLDLDKKELDLGVTTTYDKRDDTLVLARIVSRIKSGPAVAGEYTKLTEGKARFVVAGVKAPISASIYVVVRDKNSNQEKVSKPWELAIRRSTLPKPILLILQQEPVTSFA